MEELLKQREILTRVLCTKNDKSLWIVSIKSYQIQVRSIWYWFILHKNSLVSILIPKYLNDMYLAILKTSAKERKKVVQ